MIYRHVTDIDSFTLFYQFNFKYGNMISVQNVNLIIFLFWPKKKTRIF